MTTVLRKRNDKITFGKHKGKRVSEVIRIDPQYLVWLDENTDKTEFDIPLIHHIQKMARVHEDEYYDRKYEDMDWGDFVH